MMEDLREHNGEQRRGLDPPGKVYDICYQYSADYDEDELMFIEDSGDSAVSPTPIDPEFPQSVENGESFPTELLLKNKKINNHFDSIPTEEVAEASSYSPRDDVVDVGRTDGCTSHPESPEGPAQEALQFQKDVSCSTAVPPKLGCNCKEEDSTAEKKSAEDSSPPHDESMTVPPQEMNCENVDSFLMPESHEFEKEKTSSSTTLKQPGGEASLIKTKSSEENSTDEEIAKELKDKDKNDQDTATQAPHYETQPPRHKPNPYSKNLPRFNSGEPPTEPGAYFVKKFKMEGKELVKIVVPKHVRPNELFEVRLGIRHIRIVCPPTARPGSELSVEVDKEDRFEQNLLKPAILTVSPVAQKIFGKQSSSQGTTTIGGAYTMIPSLKQVYRDAKQDAPNVRTKFITIPDSAVPGEKFEYYVDGKRYRLLCPANSKVGDRIRIAIKEKKPPIEAPAQTQTVSVFVPGDVAPGEAFAVQLSAWPSPITITRPLDSSPGDLMKLHLPTDQVLASIRVQYPSETWVRTVRFRDLQFQWVRLTGENSSIVDENDMFHFYKSAFCRTVRVLEGNDPRMCTGRVSFVPAAKAVVDSRLVVDNETTVTYAEIAALQGSPRIDKHEWFLDMCRKMVKKDDNHVKIAVRRDHLLPDSLKAVMSLEREELRRIWEIKFIGEDVRDRGGPMKEWFELVTRKLLDPDAGYFVFSQSNNAAVEINPTSYIICAGDHLLYYRFFGRLLGRALFCGHLIKGNFTSVFFKFLLGWPINSKDISDAALYNSLCAIASATELEGHHYTFTATENAFFRKVDHELIENGLTTFVSTENRDLFLERMIRYHLFERTLPQLTEVVLGFFDVVPEPLLTIFDAKELELILCGMPRIQLDDWQANTVYVGLFAETGPLHPVVRWFWKVVEDFDPELRARLLQFATGSSGVPFLGFQHLRGHDDRPNLFTIQGVSLDSCLYPKAHSCFNTIDLPLFKTIDDLREKLTLSITTAFVGFDDE